MKDELLEREEEEKREKARRHEAKSRSVSISALLPWKQTARRIKDSFRPDTMPCALCS